MKDKVQMAKVGNAIQQCMLEQILVNEMNRDWEVERGVTLIANRTIHIFVYRKNDTNKHIF